MARTCFLPFAWSHSNENRYIKESIMHTQAVVIPMNGRPFVNALIWNTIWVQIAGLPRYFFVVIPLLRAAYPDNPDVAPVTVPIFASWALWTIPFMLISTGFHWMYLDRNGITVRNMITAGTWFSICTVGLTWWAITNMGLASISLFLVATPIAIVEQIISAYIVSRAMHPREQVDSAHLETA
jgi:hypothetical protein